MNPLLNTIITSARNQAEATIADNAQPMPDETETAKGKRLITVARARSQLDWANFAERQITTPPQGITPERKAP